ncbi:malate dehydrogenase, NAD-dependent, partial [mine drainage metagenome]
MKPKISIIGAGNVGANLAQFLVIKELGDVYLFDVVDGVPEGKSLDILEGNPHWGVDSFSKGFTTIDENAYENMENSDVIIITAGLARKPGMSRDDLLGKKRSDNIISGQNKSTK